MGLGNGVKMNKKRISVVVHSIMFYGFMEFCDHDVTTL